MNSFTDFPVGLLNYHKASFLFYISDVDSPWCPRNTAFDTRPCLLQLDTATYGKQLMKFTLFYHLILVDFPHHLPKEPLCYLKTQRMCLLEETSKKGSP